LTGDAEYAFPRSRSDQWTDPVFASKQVITPASETTYSSSPAASGVGVFGASFRFDHLTVPVPVGSIASRCGLGYPVWTTTNPAATTGRVMTDQPGCGYRTRHTSAPSAGSYAATKSLAGLTNSRRPPISSRRTTRRTGPRCG